MLEHLVIKEAVLVQVPNHMEIGPHGIDSWVREVITNVVTNMLHSQFEVALPIGRVPGDEGHMVVAEPTHERGREPAA